MVTEIERFSPEALMKQWLSVLPEGIEQMQNMFANLFLGSTGQNKGNPNNGNRGG